ncbi:MAG TPA: peptide chain release factor-like protein [Deltaproteobacteria bacterium]|jgi:protein subunit release factor B|nr:peptide chain release factor-like protein [Deltaproteobacteria bacterium]HOI06056.1 peptide chain release factor-like protein [Deltaproteobacteria bacterium]
MGGNAFIGPEKIRQLEERMGELGIREQDIEERFIRAQGRGGQKVNKTSSCVHLRHIPTGIEVKSQETRSREANRFFARRTLADKVEASRLGRDSSLGRKIEKIRKQKSKRAKRARAKAESGSEGEG